MTAPGGHPSELHGPRRGKGGPPSGGPPSQNPPGHGSPGHGPPGLSLLVMVTTITSKSQMPLVRKKLSNLLLLVLQVALTTSRS